MLNIILVSTHANNTAESLQESIDNISLAMEEQNFLVGIVENIGFKKAIDFTQIEITLLGMSLKDDQESKNRLIHSIEFILDLAGEKENLVVSRLSNEYIPGDTTTDLKTPAPKSFNATVLDFLGITKNPDEFNCNISFEIMGECVYIEGNKPIKYDINNLLHWEMSQSGLVDPYRKVPFEQNEVRQDKELQQRLDNFMAPHKLKYIKVKYNLPNTNPASLHKALRTAATNGYDADLMYLLTIVDNVNDQDSNPKFSRTALHWACLKKREVCIKLLLDAGAGFNIKDADGKTAVELAPREFLFYFQMIDASIAINRRLNSLSAHIANFVALVHDKALMSPKVKKGLFANRLPRDLRMLIDELKTVANGHTVKEAYYRLMTLANRFYGANDPITITSRKCYTLAHCLEGSDVQVELCGSELKVSTPMELHRPKV